MPFQAAGQSRDYEKLGYWSRPFHMTPEDVPVITYTVPLFDRTGQVHGVIGVEISLEHIRKAAACQQSCLPRIHRGTWLPQCRRTRRSCLFWSRRASTRTDFWG